MAEEGYRLSDRESAYDLAAEMFAPVYDYVDDLMMQRVEVSEQVIAEFEQLVAPLSELEQKMVVTDIECARIHDVEEIADSAIDVAEQRWLDENHDRIALLLAE